MRPGAPSSGSTEAIELLSVTERSGGRGHPPSVLPAGRRVPAAHARLGVVDQEESRAADLVVPTQHQVETTVVSHPGCPNRAATSMEAP